MAPHDEGFKSNEALETDVLTQNQSSYTTENERKMRARGGVEWEKKTNDALPGSWRIDYDGLPLFPSCMLWLCLLSISLFTCSYSFPWLALIVAPVGEVKEKLLTYGLCRQFLKKKRKERKESGLSNKIELSKAHKINHVRKMKGARRADGLRVCTASRALVCGPLKATVSAHHLTEVNGPTQAVDLLIFLHALGDRVTEWHTHTHIHRHPVRLSQSFLLSLSVSPSRTHSPAAENTWRRGHSFTCHTNKWHFR